MASPVIRESVEAISGLSCSTTSATQAGDLVYVITWERTTGSSPPTHTLQGGYDEIISQGLTEASSSGRASIARKIAAGGVESFQAYTTDSGTTEYWTGLVVYQVGTFDTSGIVAAGTSTTNTAAPNPPAVTIDSATEYSITIYGFWRLSAAGTNNAASVANYTDVWETTGSQTGHSAVRFRDLTGVASEDPASIADSVTPTGTAAITIALPEPSTVTLERAASLDAVADVASVPQRDLLRSASIDPTAVIDSVSQRDVLRQSSVDAVAEIVAAGIKITPAVERAASLDAVADVASIGQRDIVRQVSLDATGTVVAAALRIADRTASLDAIANIVSVGQRDLFRQTSLDAVADIVAAGGVVGGPATLERSASLDGLADILAVPQRELFRQVSLDALAEIAASGQTGVVGGPVPYAEAIDLFTEALARDTTTVGTAT